MAHFYYSLKYTRQDHPHIFIFENELINHTNKNKSLLRSIIKCVIDKTYKYNR